MNRRSFTSAICAATILTTLLPVAFAQNKTAEQPIVTIIGDIENSNRPAFDEFLDAYLNFKEVSFDKAFQLTLRDLQALPQKTIIAHAESWPSSVRLEGPSLEHVLEQAGATGKPVTVIALDGYSVSLSARDITSSDWILAWKANDKPLSIGGRGPVWVIHSSAGKQASSDIEARWVWSVFVIKAGN